MGLNIVQSPLEVHCGLPKVFGLLVSLVQCGGLLENCAGSNLVLNLKKKQPQKKQNVILDSAVTKLIL